ncbi:hypothetical protein JIN85_13200 [Luteolibacter pohnpeiensis]|uniref:Uncharacterized protein n=1 Tax=Luteolibacter pohnpeiensis TaxID=454153 RepID=A0A934S7Q5_9BACT|nr:hypothetical protein [Luteolibacter pohnpeiensis]MBK1883378.1 hypothetical protein [Luteolibacter pohnpeiensis]
MHNFICDGMEALKLTRRLISYGRSTLFCDSFLRRLPLTKLSLDTTTAQKLPITVFRHESDELWGIAHLFGSRCREHKISSALCSSAALQHAINGYSINLYDLTLMGGTP